MIFFKKVQHQITLCVMGLCCTAYVNAKSIDMDIFAIPSTPIKNLVEKTSNQLKQYDINSFYAQGFPVHITLYLTSFPQGSEEALKQAVQKIVAQHKSFALQAKGITVTKGNWAFIDVNNSTQLQRLADEVTLATETLRDPNPALPDWVKAYPNKLAAFERYGSPNVFQNFQPHLTLLASEKNPKLADFDQWMKQHPPTADGEIIGLGIGIADKLGQQKKVIATYYFQ